MKTQTFIKEVEQLGFYTLTDGKDIYIFDREISEEELYYEDDTYAIATIGTDEYRDFVIEGKLINKDTDVNKIYSLFKLIMEYAKTPVEYRGPEKKYYLKHRFVGEYNCDKFLNHVLLDDKWILSSKDYWEGYKVTFTQKQIDEIKKKLDTDLKDFEIIEVK